MTYNPHFIGFLLRMNENHVWSIDACFVSCFSRFEQCCLFIYAFALLPFPSGSSRSGTSFFLYYPPCIWISSSKNPLPAEFQEAICGIKAWIVAVIAHCFDVSTKPHETVLSPCKPPFNSHLPFPWGWNLSREVFPHSGQVVQIGVRAKKSRWRKHLSSNPGALDFVKPFHPQTGFLIVAVWACLH